MRVFRVGAGALVGVFVAYLLGAFAVWDLNPGHWDSVARLICAALIFPTSAAVGVGVIMAMEA